MTTGTAMIYGLVVANGLFQSAELQRTDAFKQCNGWAIRFDVGLGAERVDYQYAGDAPAVTLYSETGGFLASIKHTTLGVLTEDEDWWSCIPNYGSTERAAYIALASAGKNDAICLSAVSVVNPDGHISVVTGDMAAHCGYANGYSIASYGSAQPRCMWLDGDYTHGNENGDGFMQGLTFHLRDFEPTDERVKYYNAHPDLLCKSEPLMYPHYRFDQTSHFRIFEPALRYYDGELDKDYEHIQDPSTWGWSDYPLPYPGGKFKRAAELFTAVTSSISRLLTPAPAVTSFYDRFEGTIIRSNQTSQSAVTLCSTPSMHGPDFVSLQEQIFCDMRTRQIYPVCNTDAVEAQGTCFDLDDNRLLPSTAVVETAGYDPVKVRPLAGVPVKTYHKIWDWD